MNGPFCKDQGIDLGTANTLVYVKNQGIVINEPSVVAINKKTGLVLAVGTEAKRMMGRTPGHIIASKPLVEGVISDYEVTEAMLRYFVQQIHKKGILGSLARPRIVIGIPSEVTEVERSAVEDATRAAGAREVILIDEPLAAAIGAGLPIGDPTGSMIVDIGGGTSEVAVISLGGLVIRKSLRVAGDKMIQDIISFIRNEHNVLIGEQTGEELKIKIGSAIKLSEPDKSMAVRGRDLLRGLPKEIVITSAEIREALRPSLKTITRTIKDAIEETPPELLADIMKQNIIMTGGGSLLRGLPQLVEQVAEIPTRVTEDPLTTVARGTGIVLENTAYMKQVLAAYEPRRSPK